MYVRVRPGLGVWWLDTTAGLTLVGGIDSIVLVLGVFMSNCLRDWLSTRDLMR